jgi:hypothetical protein
LSTVDVMPSDRLHRHHYRCARSGAQTVIPCVVTHDEGLTFIVTSAAHRSGLNTLDATLSLGAYLSDDDCIPHPGWLIIVLAKELRSLVL